MKVIATQYVYKVNKVNKVARSVALRVAEIMYDGTSESEERMLEAIKRVVANRRKVGMLVAARDEQTGNAYLGWSRCRKGETFSRSFGLAVATGRVRKMYEEDSPMTFHNLPESMVLDSAKFVNHVYAITHRDELESIQS